VSQWAHPGPLVDVDGVRCWPVADVLNAGLLWAINTHTLHPRGYALIAHYSDEACTDLFGMSVHQTATGHPIVYPKTDVEPTVADVAQQFARAFPHPHR